MSTMDVSATGVAAALAGATREEARLFMAVGTAQGKHTIGGTS